MWRGWDPVSSAQDVTRTFNDILDVLCPNHALHLSEYDTATGGTATVDQQNFYCIPLFVRRVHDLHNAPKGATTELFLDLVVTRDVAFAGACLYEIALLRTRAPSLDRCHRTAAT